MSPILVRPVREQLEHDRVIRLLQAKNRRRFEAGINPGAEQNVPVGTGPTASCVITSGSRRPLASVRLGLVMVIVGGMGTLLSTGKFPPRSRSEKPFCTSYSGLKRL